jgi:TolB-like protein/Tfp pilus assembly protein PilF
MPQDRRLAAIMFTDIVGYTKLMGSDEDKAFDMLKRNHMIHANLIEKHNGTLIKEIGDGTLASFPLASDAVRCAMDIQKEAKSQNIPLKIGIHEGEMVMADEDVFGDGVNIASRLQEISADGSITISGRVYSDVKNKTGIKTKFIGDKRLKNVDDPVKVYEVFWEEEKGKPIEGNEVKSRVSPLYYVLVGIIVVLAAIIIWQLLPTKEPITTISEEVEKSIAVLPFRNDSPDKGNEYFCNGMLEEILTHLQKIEDMSVKSRTTSEQYRDAAKDLKIIAEELDVAYLLEGSVRKSGDDIRITAQLINGTNGDHLWAETYDGKYTDQIFDFQSDVAKKIAASLNAVITPAEMKRIEGKKTNEIKAYDLVLKGFDELNKFDDSSDSTHIKSALLYFDNAIKIDPGYTDAIVSKGNLYMDLGMYDSAYYYAEKTIERDPENEHGYGLLGRYYFAIGNADLAIEYNKKSIDFAPNNYSAYYMLGIIYLYQKNDVMQGFKYMDKAADKAVGRYGTFWVFGFIGLHFARIGDYEKAEEYFLTSLTLRPSCQFIDFYAASLLNTGKTYKCLQFLDSISIVSDCERNCIRGKFLANFYNRDLVSAEEILEQYAQAGYSLRTEDSLYLAYIYSKTGREEKTSSMLMNIQISLEGQLSDSDDWLIYALLFQTHAMKDEMADALIYLNLMVEKGRTLSMSSDYLKVNPISEKYIDDPEFQSILTRIEAKRAAAKAQVDAMRASGEIDL